MKVYWVHLPNSNIKTDGYVGITNNTKQRWTKHKRLISESRHLKNAILKYNSELIWEVVFTGSEEGCTQLEEYFRPEPDIGWNIRSGGKYYKHSEEVKVKIGQANTGKKHSDEHKTKIGQALTGRKYSEESKQKMSEAQKGKELSEETKAKIRSAKARIFVNIFNAETNEVVALNVGLKEWTKEMVLDITGFYKVLQGKRKTAKGYRIEEVLLWNLNQEY